MIRSFRSRWIASLFLTLTSLTVPVAAQTPPIQLELLPAQPVSGEETVTRLIIYYKDESAEQDQNQNADPNPDPSLVPDPDRDLNSEPVSSGQSTSSTSSTSATTSNANAKHDELVVPGLVHVDTEFGDGTPLMLPVPLSIPEATAYAAELERDPQVRAVLVDRRIVRHANLNTNDTFFYVLWNLAEGDPGSSVTEPVWPQGTGNGVTVAVLDTGMVAHQDMINVWAGGYDLISDVGLAGDGTGRDADPTDTMSCNSGSGAQNGTPHGLMVGSVIAARVNNFEGIAGVAPSARIMPVRVISSCGGWLSDVLDGMRWAVGLPVSGLPVNPNPVRVLNLSLGTTSPGVACSSTIQAIVNEVRATGATIVVSTGNDGADAISVPAACNGVIAVTASSKHGNRASYANAGAGTTISAPGGGCQTGADPSCAASAYNYVPVASHDGTSGTYVMSAGTSFAAPHVAGAAALLLERNPNRTPDAVTTALVNSARSFTSSGCPLANCGAGMLDIKAALASQGFSVSAQASSSAARAGRPVTLMASVSSQANSPTFEWRQAAGSPVVLVPTADGDSVTFTAPHAVETLSFEVTATDTSGLQRVASVSTAITIAPQLAPISPVQALPNTEVRQVVKLSDGSEPSAITVDAAASARGVSVNGAEVVWTVPATGNYTIEVTPYDSVGAGDSAAMAVYVVGTNDSAAVNPLTSSGGSGGGGAIGLHGGLLLALAWLARRRLRSGPARSGSLHPVAP